MLFPRPEPIEGMALGTQTSVDSDELLLSEFCNPAGLMFNLGPYCTASDQAGFGYLLLAKVRAVGECLRGTPCPVRPPLLSVLPLAVSIGYFPSSLAGHMLMALAYQAGVIYLLILQFTKKRDRKFLSLPKSPNMWQSIEPRSV